MAWRGQLSRNLKELRILFSPSSHSSSSTRVFIENNYKDLKMKNPKLPIFIREATDIEPQLCAGFGMGVERGLLLEGLNEEQILRLLRTLIKPGQPLKAEAVALGFSDAIKRQPEFLELILYFDFMNVHSFQTRWRKIRLFIAFHGMRYIHQYMFHWNPMLYFTRVIHR